MIHLVSTLWVVAIAIQTCLCRPSTSLENEESKFGYKYKVSHSPGASNVHLSFGKSKLDQTSYNIPERDSRTYQYEPSSLSKSHQPTHLSPASYFADGGHHGRPDSISRGPGQIYASPYDSDRKQISGDYSINGETHEPKHYQSVPESYTPSFHSGSGVNEPPKSHYSSHDLNAPLHTSNPTIASGSSYPVPTSQNHIDVPVHSPNPHYSVQASNPVHHPQQERIAPEEIGSYAQHPPQPIPIAQHSVDVQPYAQDPNLAIPPSHPIPVSQHDINVPSYSHDPIQSPPVGAKYAIIPSGPPYTKDTFTADIIHGPQTGEASPVLVAPVYETNKPAPVSHSILLPYGPSAPHPVSESSPSGNIPLPYPDSHINTLTPTSHSSQILLPASVDSIDTVGIKTIPSPNSHFQPQEKIEDLTPISHSTQLLIPSPALPSNPTLINVDNHHLPSPENIASLPPLSHSSQIILPIAVPQVNQDGIKTVSSGFIAENAPIPPQEKIDNLAPFSHSTRLLIPVSEKTAPVETFHSVDQTVSGLVPIAPPSHATKLLIPSDIYLPQTPGVSEPVSVHTFTENGHVNNPEFSLSPFPPHPVGLFSETGPNHFESSPDLSPASHSFRLNVPQLTPGVLPVIPDEKPGENFTPIAVDTPTIKTDNNIPPTSHSFKLILPEPYALPDLTELSGGNADKDEIKDGLIPIGADAVTLAWPPTPTEQNAFAPQVQYTEPNPQNENFKSSDASLLAVEAKKPRRKGRKIRKRS
ncbi:uncharacterized protein [Parasteatoda tepidariorum]|uniref:uncharacterized protein n=1 Tax=Parasteatoda tepidariorum TaxID=114398 RepID=UPI00077F875E|nr:extensin-like [Parasteatoda tepidariorum]